MSKHLVPVPMTRSDLEKVLRDMLLRVKNGDSFEGSIQYTMPTVEDVPDDTYAMVQASYRIGNLEGQGSLRIVGKWSE